MKERISAKKKQIKQNKKREKKTRMLGRANKIETICFWLGMAAVLFMAVPYFLLGQDAIVTYHDQLDGEMIAYILQAKHLFSGEAILPEFMNGALKTALTLPAPACVLLFLSGNYFWALIFMQIAGSICGYLGIYFLIKDVVYAEKAKEVLENSQDRQCKGKWKLLWLSGSAVITGVLFAYLPFRPVYGLTQYGLPLLLWCLIALKKDKHKKIAFTYIVLYTLNSSLVLAGFGVLGALLLWILWLIYQRYSGFKKQQKKAETKAEIKRLSIAWGIMLVLYILENSSLLGQLLGIGQTQISHKTEYKLVAEDFGNTFVESFLAGGQHSEDFHKYFIGIAILILLLGLWKIGNQKNTEKQISFEFPKRLLCLSCICFGWNCFFALITALWGSEAGVALRFNLQALKAFQLERLLWLTPCFWYLLLGCTFGLVFYLLEDCLENYKNKFSCFITMCSTFVFVGIVCFTGIQILLQSNLKPNLQKLRNPEYHALSYQDYYAIGVMEQVEKYLLETTGQTKEQYRVVSLGIDPAAALYHGFYCLDGYSNHYDLEYKHQFAKILAPELAKSEYLTDYFVNWGNRCYLFSAECPAYYTIEKNGFYFQNYEIDKESLLEMGGRYLLSAAYIMNAEEQGLTLLNEEPIETPDSYYRIYIYDCQ